MKPLDINFQGVPELEDVSSIFTVIMLLPFSSKDTQSFTELIHMQVLYSYCKFSTDNYVNHCVLIAFRHFILRKLTSESYMRKIFMQAEYFLSKFKYEKARDLYQ